VKQIRLDRKKNNRENQEDTVLSRRLRINQSCTSNNFELLLINGVERKLVERNETNSRWVLTRLGCRVARQANRFKQLTIKQPTWEPSNPNQS
jgi:hypothetical protein